MKRKFLIIVAGVSVALLSVVGPPAYARGVDTAGAAASVAADMGVLVAAPVRAELVVATAEPESLGPAAAMARGLTQQESQRDATAALADMGKSTTHRESRPEARFMVLALDRKVERLPSSLLRRRAIPVAITLRKIDPGLVLRVSPLSSHVIMREKIGTYVNTAWARLKKAYLGPAVIGLDRT